MVHCQVVLSYLGFKVVYIYIFIYTLNISLKPCQFSEVKADLRIVFRHMSKPKQAIDLDVILPWVI